MKIIGVWISEKKSQKLNWSELIKACSRYKFKLLQVDLNMDLEALGTIHVFLHKLTDLLAAAMQGDETASIVVKKVEQYLSNHPETIVIDPLDSVRILLNRNIYYKILEEEFSHTNDETFTPPFAEFLTNNVEANIEILENRGVTFPVVCKATIAHGSKLAHQMILIFNKGGLKYCKAPCVVQSFVNHNAVLHKVFVVGNRYHVCERPSLKNFYASEDMDPIFYTTGEVCKADSQSTLSILDPHERSDIKLNLHDDKVEKMIEVLRRRVGLLLAGFDVVIDNVTGKHAVIDINVFPSYDIFPNFFEHLLESVEETVASRDSSANQVGKCNKTLKVVDDLTDTGIKGMNII